MTEIKSYSNLLRMALLSCLKGGFSHYLRWYLELGRHLIIIANSYWSLTIWEAFICFILISSSQQPCDKVLWFSPFYRWENMLRLNKLLKVTQIVVSSRAKLLRQAVWYIACALKHCVFLWSRKWPGINGEGIWKRRTHFAMIGPPNTMRYR